MHQPINHELSHQYRTSIETLSCMKVHDKSKDVASPQEQTIFFQISEFWVHHHIQNTTVHAPLHRHQSLSTNSSYQMLLFIISFRPLSSGYLLAPLLCPSFSNLCICTFSIHSFSLSSRSLSNLAFNMSSFIHSQPTLYFGLFIQSLSQLISMHTRMPRTEDPR